MREFIYGVIIGAGVLLFWQRVDVPYWWNYLTGATEYATKSTAGYGGKFEKRY